MKLGIKGHSDKRKQLVIKDIKNFSAKNEYFGDLEYVSLAQEMKDKFFSLLMLIAVKSNSETKIHGSASCRFQRTHISKNNHS